MTDQGAAHISIAQNRPSAQRLLAAQSRLYSEAKVLHGFRFWSVLILAVATIAVALAVPNLRPVIGMIGGTITFLWSLLASEREKRRRREAALVQEEFDTSVFELPWNAIVADHPSPTLVAEAAARYRGSRTLDWYPDTGSATRPLDVLICQRSNLGWGASTHVRYAASLTAGLVLMVVLGGAIAWAAGLSAVEAFTVVVVPALAPARELIELIRAHRDSAASKSKTEAKVLDLWNRGVRGEEISVEDCRAVQDRILTIRQTNAQIPDWFDNLGRGRSDAAMRASAADMVEEAVRRGRTR